MYTSPGCFEYHSLKISFPLSVLTTLQTLCSEHYNVHETNIKFCYSKLNNKTANAIQ